MIDQYAPAPPQGWPKWMDREIQAAHFVLLVCTEIYLQRVEGREQPGKGRGVVWESDLIYNLLYEQNPDVQRFIPVLFAGGQSSFIPLRLRGLAHYYVDTEEGYESLYRQLTNQPRNLKPELGARRSLPAREPQSYPSSLAAKPDPKPPSSLEQRHRAQLLKQVRLDWIEGVLNQSLYKVARLELGLENKSDLVEQPLNAVIQVPDRTTKPIVPGTPISQIFDEHGGALLILGGPGAGKTTCLLELAQDLLDRADRDESQPTPVVFPLSSWAARRQSLTEWLIAELNQRSYVPKKVARQWVEAEQILPLLDGLDEVATEHREACVVAINQFRRERGLLPIAVCSRIADYEALGTKLRLRTALEVQPLNNSQVKDYLACVGQPLLALRTALEADASLWELLETPLMLWVAIFAYRDVPLASMQGIRAEQRQRRLFAHFVEVMFRRRANQRRYTPEQTKLWLSWLASALMRNNQSILYLENLNFDWLPTRIQQWLARAGVVLVTGMFCVLFCSLLFGLLFGLSEELIGGLIVGLIVGPIGGLLSILMKLQPVEQTKFSWITLASRMSIARRNGLTAGLIFGLTFGPVCGLILGLMGGLREGLIAGLSLGLLYGSIVGLIVGIVLLFTSDATAETRSTPNQGTQRSIKMAILFGLFLGLIFGLLFGLVSGLREGVSEELVFGLLFGLFLGLIFGGMFSGGLFSAKHYALRLFLSLSRAAPLNYVAFLNEAKDLLFLRQVGGGYIFTHRLLREYFASLSQAEKDSEPRAKTASAA